MGIATDHIRARPEDGEIWLWVVVLSDLRLVIAGESLGSWKDDAMFTNNRNRRLLATLERSCQNDARSNETC